MQPNAVIATPQDTVLGYLEKAKSIIAAVVATGVVSTAQGVNIETVLADLESVVNDSKVPSASLINDVQHVLSDLMVNNVVAGSVIAQVANGLQQFSAFVKDVESSQLGVIKSNTELFGVKGLYAFIPYSSQIASDYGLGSAEPGAVVKQGNAPAQVENPNVPQEPPINPAANAAAAMPSPQPPQANTPAVDIQTEGPSTPDTPGFDAATGHDA